MKSPWLKDGSVTRVVAFTLPNWDASQATSCVIIPSNNFIWYPINIHYSTAAETAVQSNSIWLWIRIPLAGPAGRFLPRRCAPAPGPSSSCTGPGASCRNGPRSLRRRGQSAGNCHLSTCPMCEIARVSLLESSLSIYRSFNLSFVQSIVRSIYRSLTGALT